MNTDFLLIVPVGTPSRRPGGARGLELFLQLRQIDFDQLPQLDQDCFEILCCRVVLIDLSLSRTRDGHALRADDVADSIVDRWRRVDVALACSSVATQSTQDLVRSSIERGRVVV